MNWMTVIWPMVTGACFTLALINLRIACGDRRAAPHLFFAFASLAVAAISGFELALMRTSDLVTYDAILRWAVVPIGIMMASTAGFVWSFFHAGRTWLGITSVLLNLSAQMADFVTPVPAVRHAVALRQQETFGGVHFTIPTIVSQPIWEAVDILSVLFLIAYTWDAAWVVWKRGERRRALVIGWGVTLFLLGARGHAILVERGILPTPYLVSFSFLGLLIAIGIELTDDVLHTARIARNLKESERRIDLAARAAALGFWTWDITSNEIWANPAARALFGIRQSEKLNLSHFFGLLHPEDRQGVEFAIQESLSDGKEYEREYRTQLPDGKIRWIAARGKADQQEKVMRGVVMDITAQRGSEQELEQVRSQLAHSGRVSMMGQLASALAHELNQPLGAILRNAEAAEIFLQSTSPDIEELRAIIGDIRKDDQRAGQVIDRLRSMLKRRDLESMPISIQDLLNESITLARADAASRQVGLEISIAPDLPPVKGDRVHLQQVLLNLLINAMDAMNGSSKGARRVVLSAEPDGQGKLLIAVKDSGHGIAPESLGHVFDPFFTTKSHGMGMGLAISQTIIVSHGGELSAKNNPDGVGATFRFTLPVAEEGLAA